MRLTMKSKMTHTSPANKHLTRKDSNDRSVRSSDRMSKNERQQDIVFLSILIIFCLIMFFTLLGSRPLWDVDEGMHAATSKDMILSGDWITPQFNGENFYDKPVLFNWLAAISFLVFGFTEFAARLPAAVLGTGCVLATYFIGKRMHSAPVGLIGGLILATSVEFIVLSRVVVHDIALAFFITLALYFFFLGYTEPSRRKSVWFLFYVSLGFAVLAKGPIGLLLPGLILFIFILIKHRWDILKNMQIGWGILIFLSIAGPWYGLIILQNRDYAGYFFIQQNLAYFFSGESRHPEPFYYYIPILVGGFFPWFLFLPTAIYRTLKKGVSNVNDGTLLLLIWFGATFIFFSIASSKLSTYILPLFPAVSLLVAKLWNDILRTPPNESFRNGMLYPLAFLLLLTTAAMVYLLIKPLDVLMSQYGIEAIRINMISTIMVTCTGLTLFFFVKRFYRFSFATMTATVVLGIFLFLLLIVPYINPYRSTKGLADKLDTLLPPGKQLTFFHRIQDTALFYTNRKAEILWGDKALRDYLSSEKRVFCVMEKKYFDALKKVLPSAHIWGQEGDKLLISNEKPL